MTTPQVSITKNKIEVAIDGVTSFLNFYQTIDKEKTDRYIEELTYDCMLKIQQRNNSVVQTDLPYNIKRANEYPSIQDQLDTLFHGGYDAWKEQIQAIKDKYPKP